MLRLPDLQRAFQRVITRGMSDFAHAGGSGFPMAEIHAQGGLPAAARLDIYARMYRARLVDALIEDYPRVAATLGAEAFAAVADEYVTAHPSTHPSLRWFGHGLGDFLTTRGDRIHPEFLADLARLEWARLAVFDATDVALLDVEALRRLPAAEWPSLRLRPVPALVLLDVAWPVHRIWGGAEPETIATLSREDTSLRVWRQGDQVFQASMDEIERSALRHVQARDDFGELCTGIATIVPAESVAATAGALVLRWIEDGILRADGSRA